MIPGSDHRKHVLIVAYGQLSLNGSAGQAVMCGLVEAALRRGFRVTYVGLLRSGDPSSKNNLFSPAVNPEFLSIEEAEYSQRAGNRLESFLYQFDHAVLESLTKPCEALSRSYDAAIAFESFAISLIAKVKAGSCVAILGDPTSQRLRHSTFLPWKRRMLHSSILSFLELRYFRPKLNPKWVIGVFGTSHSRQASKVLRHPVLDLRPFLTSNITSSARSMEAEKAPDPSVAIVYGGTLAGTASRVAFRFLNDELLPDLRITLGVGRFVFKVVGSYLDEYVSLAHQYREVALTGRVPVFETELEGCDVFVLPMDYPVGVRTRVCSALQAGCYCVCHPSVLVNMPELADCAAVKIAKDVRQFSRAVADFPLDAESRRKMKIMAKDFFKQHYFCEVAAGPILDGV